MCIFSGRHFGKGTKPGEPSVSRPMSMRLWRKSDLQNKASILNGYLYDQRILKEAALTCSIVRRARELLLIAVGLSVLVRNELRPKILEGPQIPTNLTGGTEA